MSWVALRWFWRSGLRCRGPFPQQDQAVYFPQVKASPAELTQHVFEIRQCTARMVTGEVLRGFSKSCGLLLCWMRLLEACDLDLAFLDEIKHVPWICSVRCCCSLVQGRTKHNSLGLSTSLSGLLGSALETLDHPHGSRGMDEDAAHDDDGRRAKR